MSRTDPSVFQLPVEKMRAGWYSDQYFNHTKTILQDSGFFPEVTMQCFQRENSFAGGVDEAIAILRLCAGYVGKTYDWENWKDGIGGPAPQGDGWIDGWDQLEVKALNEGDPIVPWEPVLQIKGPYHLFAPLETPILGVMARRSLVMKNTHEVVEAANGKPIIFMPARHDHWVVQTGDGLAAAQAGISQVSTDANAEWWGGRGMGTIPHALIAAYDGNTVKAARAFADRFGDEMNVTVLVDFDNTSIDTALDVAADLEDRLWGVRLDNSGTLIDQSTYDDYGIMQRHDFGQFKATGVNPQLVEQMRGALNETGSEHVKIVVSGGFKAEKIREFEAANVPVDAYGVGSSLIRGSNDYTADIVKPVAKFGRRAQDDSRLEIVK